MINSIDISNFKGFKKLTIPKLGRLNLIVGKNNSGKSSILEALMVYASGGSESILRDISISHDEKVRQRDSYNEYSRDFTNDKNSELKLDIDLNINEAFPYEHLFYGRRFNKNQIKIGELDGEDQVSIAFSKRKIVNNNKKNEIIEMLRQLDLEISTPDNAALNLLEVKKGRFKHSISLTESFSYSNMAESDERTRTNFKYVKTSFESMDKLGILWDKITLTDYEEVAIKSLRLIDPSITDLRFIDRGERRSSRTAIIRLDDGSIFPIKSMGDGIVRVLELILNLYSARDGFFLIDEFDNGLHFSVQKPLWEIIFNLSKYLNVQVFATTHSWDCIQSFTEVAIENEEIEGVLLKIGKSKLSKNKGQAMVTVFDEEKLNTITQKMVEVR
ncbi:TPA: ATP/GTP-binding protein [Yersinia enterocolitica]